MEQPRLGTLIAAARRAEPAADVSALGAEVDRLVSGLYGATTAEG